MCDLMSGTGRCGYHLRLALSSLKVSEDVQVLKAASEAGINIPDFPKELSEDEAQTVKQAVRNDPAVQAAHQKSNEAKRALLKEQNKYALALSSKDPMVVAQYFYESTDEKGKDEKELKALETKRDAVRAKLDEIYKDDPYNPNHVDRAAKVESNFKTEKKAALHSHRRRRDNYIKLGQDAIDNANPNTLRFASGPRFGKYPARIGSLKQEVIHLEKMHEDNVNLVTKRESKKIVIRKRVATPEFQSFREKHFDATPRGREYHGKRKSLMKEFVQTKSYRSDLEKKIEQFEGTGRDSGRLKDLLAKANRANSIVEPKSVMNLVKD